MGSGKTDGLNFKLFYEEVGNERASEGTQSCTMDLFIILTLEEEVGVFKAKFQQGDDWVINMEVLFGSKGPVIAYVELWWWQDPQV